MTSKNSVFVKNWREKNRERFNEYMRKFYSSPEQKEKKKEYVRNNLEKTKEYQKEYQKKYGQENKERLNSYRREWLRKRKLQAAEDKNI